MDSYIIYLHVLSDGAAIYVRRDYWPAEGDLAPFFWHDEHCRDLLVSQMALKGAILMN
jgi:hypothetical protein